MFRPDRALGSPGAVAADVPVLLGITDLESAELARGRGGFGVGRIGSESWTQPTQMRLGFRWVRRECVCFWKSSEHIHVGLGPSDS